MKILKCAGLLLVIITFTVQAIPYGTVYQLSRIGSLYTTPSVMAEVPGLNSYTSGSSTFDVPVYLENVTTMNMNDTAQFVPGPAWLLPAISDTVAYAVRLGASGQYLSFINFTTPGRQVFTSTFRARDRVADTIVLFEMYSNYEKRLINYRIIMDGLTGRMSIQWFPMVSANMHDTTDVHIPVGLWQSITIEQVASVTSNTFSLSIYLGDSCYVTRSLTLGDAVITDWNQNEKVLVSMFKSTSNTTKVDVCDLGYFIDMSALEVYNLCAAWVPVTQTGCSDTITIPLCIHGLIYDPPGDGSFSVLEKENIIRTALSIDQTFAWGGAGIVGTEFEVGTGTFKGSKVDVALKVRGDFSSGHYQEFNSEASFNQTVQSSADDAVESYVGPGRGDIVLYNSMKLARSLQKRPRIGTFGTASDSGCIFFLAHKVLPDTNSRLQVSNVADLLTSLENDSVSLAYIKNEYALDPITGKIRPELVASGRLVRMEKNWNFAGNAPVTSTERNAVSTTDTWTFKWGIGTELTAKFVIMGVKVGAEASFNYSVANSTTSGSDSIRAISYTLSDNESWDKFGINVYLDTKYGTYVFDVDSTASYSSWPYEERYSRSAVDFEAVAVDSIKSGHAGDILAYRIAVHNTSPGISAGLPDPLTFTADVINFPHQAFVLPHEVDIARNGVDTLIVHLSSPGAGTFSPKVRISLQRPGTGETTITELQLRATFDQVAQGVYLECKEHTWFVSPAQNPVSHVFNIMLKNIGETAAEIETGISSFSEGVSHQMGTFANPIASGDSSNLSVSLSCTGSKFPFTASFWAKIKGDESSLKELILSIDTSTTIEIARYAKPDMPEPRQLEIRVCGRSIHSYVPGKLPARLRIFTLSGRCIFSADNVLGSQVWADVAKLRMSSTTVYIIELRQGQNRIIARNMLQ